VITLDSFRFIWGYLTKNKLDAIFTFIIMIVLAILSIFPGIIIKRIFDNGLLIKNYNNIIMYSVILLAIYIVRSYLNYKSTFILNKYSQNIIAFLRDDVMKKVMNLPMDFFSVNESGYITARISEVNNISSLFSVNTFRILITVFEFIGVIILLLSINPYLTLILLIISPLFYIIGKKNMKSISHSSQIAVEQNAKLNSRIQQSIQGMEEVKNLSVEGKEIQKIKKENDKMLKMSIEQSNRYDIGVELISFLGILSSVLLIISGGGFVIFSNLTIGDYMVFSNYIGKLYAPMQSISVMSLTISPALVSLKRISSFMEEISEDELDENKLKLLKIDTIEFKNVTFKYKSQKEFTLNKINFSLNNNDKLMIKGGNGSGKTTILRLILALYSITSGNILINETSSSNYKKSSIRENISVVSQKIYLFNGTIKENILYGLNLSDEEFSEKIQKKEIKNLLTQLPLDENIILLDNASNLSGGQIQRIALVRGFLKEADLFLFDEITSGLDLAGINSIKDIIQENLADKLCIFVEHSSVIDNLCNKFISL
jgi:ATP-binding cassette subfamily B protein